MAKKQTSLKGAAGLVAAAVVIGGALFKSGLISQPVNHSTSGTPSQSQQLKAYSKVDFGKLTDKVPTQSLAQSVLTSNIKKSLGSSITYNGTGAFVIDKDQTNLNAKVSSAPYVQLAQQDSLGRPGLANALLNKSTRQYQNRTETSSNGKSNSATIKPVGWHQMVLKGSPYKDLYNRGHSIGYALAGNLRGFDASEANPQNISAQTAWANQASNGDKSNTGQNYYESLVRQALDKGKTVRYRVTPLYDGNNLVPSGTHIEAKAKDGSLEFNVFIPNVEPGVQINYASGFGTKVN